MSENELTKPVTDFEKRVFDLFEKKIRPTVQLDGGDIILISADETTGNITVRLAGACVGCPLSSITLTLGVERELLEHIPEFVELIVENEQ